MSSIARQCTAAVVTLSLAAHPLLPDALVLHAHDGDDIHAHAIELHAASASSGVQAAGGHGGALPTVTDDAPEGSLIVVAKGQCFVVHRGKRTDVSSGVAVCPSLAAWRVDAGTVCEGRLERPPEVPPPRAQCALDAVLLTSNALLI